MADNVTNELIFETLKGMRGELAAMRGEVTHIRERVDAHDEQFDVIRHLLHAIQGDDLQTHARYCSLAC